MEMEFAYAPVPNTGLVNRLCFELKHSSWTRDMEVSDNSTSVAIRGKGWSFSTTLKTGIKLGSQIKSEDILPLGPIGGVYEFPGGMTVLSCEDAASVCNAASGRSRF